MEAPDGCRSRAFGRSGQLCGRSTNVTDVSLLVEPIRQPFGTKRSPNHGGSCPSLWSLLQTGGGCPTETGDGSYLSDTKSFQSIVFEFSLESGLISTATDDELVGHSIFGYPIVTASAFSLRKSQQLLSTTTVVVLGVDPLEE